MRKSKKAAKGGKPEPEEAIMKEPTKHAEEQTIDPMDFLEALAAPASTTGPDTLIAESFGHGVIFLEPEAGNSAPVQGEYTVSNGVYVFAAAEEQAIADMTAGTVADSPEIKQEAVLQAPEPAKPIPPALPRRAGCEHGFPNVALCVTCRASGRR